jgi:adenosylhomocysteine nucleosidase
MHNKKIALIAAMEREVRPLVRNWQVRAIEHDGRRYRLFEDRETALICGGIGAETARRATEAIIGEVNPARVVSVGFAGALDSSMRVGDVLEPCTVINAADGARTEVGSGDGILITSATVAAEEQKIRLRRAYGAKAVDMEAAAVAQGAQARGVEFAALKAVSDAADFNLPSLGRFVAADGTFRSASFAWHVMLRPWLWGRTMALARNSSKASRALCDALSSYLDREKHARKEPSEESSGPDRNPIDWQHTNDSMCAGAHTQTGSQPDTRAAGKRYGEL